MRLDRLKLRYLDKIDIIWKAYPLVISNVSGRRFGSRSAQVWARAQDEEPSINFQPWPVSQDLPFSSLPALEAAKCAESQGQDAFKRYHMELFRDFFEKCKDISRREELLTVAKEVGLDMKQLEICLDSEKGRHDVLSDYREMKQSGCFAGIPTAIFNGELPLTGAVPLEVYCRAVETFLDQASG